MVTTQDIMLSPPALEETVQPMDWFDSVGPFELEIGCGKGGFLLHRARSDPGLRLLGIEWASKYYRYCADRMARWGLDNVRVMRTDAREFVLKHLPPRCVDMLHLYHPDPWPKKRHLKRRLVQPVFAEAAVQTLKPGGWWRVQTDHQDYYAQIMEVLDHTADLVRCPDDDWQLPKLTDWAGTNFEVKYTKEGRPIYRAVYRRNPQTSTSPSEESC